MSERDEYLDARLADHVRGALSQAPAPPADAAYRARLKDAFVTGAIDGGEDPRVVRLPRPWFVRPAFAASLAAAAALVVVFGIANRGPAWEIEAAEGGGTGYRLTGRLAMEASPGTEVDVPRRPGRWIGRDIELTARSGVIRITTGPEFPGTTLRVHTPEADVVVTGTTLAVIMEPEGTCVCVYEGSIQMGARGGEMMGVSSGDRCFMFNDGRPPEHGDIRPAEKLNLAAFQETKEPILEGR